MTKADLERLGEKLAEEQFKKVFPSPRTMEMDFMDGFIAALEMLYPCVEAAQEVLEDVHPNSDWYHEKIEKALAKLEGKLK